MPRLSRKKQLIALEAQVAALRSELYTGEGQIADRLSAVEGVIDGHDATLDATARTLDAFPPAAAVATVASVDEVRDLAHSHRDAIGRLESTIADQQATIADQRDVIARLGARIDEVEARAAAQAAQMTRIEARLGEITEQVLRQMEEMGHEVDAAARAAQEARDSTGVPGGLLDEIQAAQTRLAGEQVRYDLALRAELAELADRFRRGGGPGAGRA